MHSVQPMQASSSMTASSSGPCSPQPGSSGFCAPPVSAASATMTTSPPGRAAVDLGDANGDRVRVRLAAVVPHPRVHCVCGSTSSMRCERAWTSIPPFYRDRLRRSGPFATGPIVGRNLEQFGGRLALLHVGQPIGRFSRPRIARGSANSPQRNSGQRTSVRWSPRLAFRCRFRRPGSDATSHADRP